MAILNQDNQKLYELWQELRAWHELLTLGFVKVTCGYVKKAKLETCLCI